MELRRRMECLEETRIIPVRPLFPLVRSVVIYAAAVVAMLVLLDRFRDRGGPWLVIPQTQLDHVWPGQPPPVRTMILLAERAEPLIPRGSLVTAVSARSPQFDGTLVFATGGLMPRHRMVFLSGHPLPDYMLVIGGEFNYPGYRVARRLPEGLIYERDR